jgi:HSP20 family protein
MNLLTRWKPFGTARWDPLNRLDDMQQQMSHLFDLAPLRSESGRELMAVAEWAPPVDITEDEQEYLIQMELPEIKREEMKLNIEHGVLSVSGERKKENEEKTRKQHRIERSYGRFVRSFTLPDDASPANVKAEFKNGVLCIHVPKDEMAKPKSIDIKVS